MGCPGGWSMKRKPGQAAPLEVWVTPLRNPQSPSVLRGVPASRHRLGGACPRALPPSCLPCGAPAPAHTLHKSLPLDRQFLGL